MLNAFAPRQADEAARPHCLCALWQLPTLDDHAPRLPGGHPAAVFAAYPSVHDRDPGAYRNAASGDALVGETGQASETSLLCSSTHRSTSFEDGTRIGGRARRG